MRGQRLARDRPAPRNARQDDLPRGEADLVRCGGSESQGSGGVAPGRSRERVPGQARGRDRHATKPAAISGEDYTIETGKGLARVRLFVSAGGRGPILHVEGSKEQVEQKATTTFLDSCRLGTGTSPRARRPTGTGPGLWFSRRPGVQREKPPENGLVGLEIGLVSFSIMTS